MSDKSYEKMLKKFADYSDGENEFSLFKSGYELAQKEMQEKLDAAIEVIKRIVDSQYRSDVSHFDVMNEAQDFLKARGG